MIVETTRYGAVRSNGKYEFIITDELDILPESVQDNVRKMRELIPKWDHDNPVLRIAKFRLQEEEDENNTISHRSKKTGR
jgi:hypothetical protein